MEILRRKIDRYLKEWKESEDRLPLIVKGARQIGKTFSISRFAQQHYEYVVNINFVLQPQYLSIFENGYEVDAVIQAIC